MKWKTLYKKSNTGDIIQWKIWTVRNVIHAEFGQVGGKLQRTTPDVIKTGKNLRSKLRTTPEEQAQAEARAKFIKQKKKGYVTDIKKAEAGEIDKTVIKGGKLPMLAKDFKKAKKKLLYPCAVQPKLDGLRMLYDDKSIWSRTRKAITKLPHIVEALENFGAPETDGEGYNHDLKDDFEEISGKITSTVNLAEGFEVIQYHIYDLPDHTKTFEERMELLEDLFRYVPEDSPLKLVPTRIVNNEEELLQAYEDFMEMGYEGAMARNLKGKYEPKRSNHLQKIKIMEDAEFKIVGIAEGRGRLAGCVGRFICEVNDKHGKRTFKAKLKGATTFLKECFEDHSLWKGKMMTVQFQGWTRKEIKPRFPVGLRFRNMDY